MGNEGPLAIIGPMAVMYLAGFICSAASIAGDNTQDLQCGYLLGATPWIQQVFQVLGVVASALVIPITLEILDKGHGIGRAVREGAPLSCGSSSKPDERHFDWNFWGWYQLELYRSWLYSGAWNYSPR